MKWREADLLIPNAAAVYCCRLQVQLSKWLPPASTATEAEEEKREAEEPPDVLVVGMGLWDALHVRSVGGRAYWSAY